MRQFIKVRCEFSGKHCWPDAPDEVSFLRDLHAHIFHVSVEIEVAHSDRDAEFWIARDRLVSAVSTVKNTLFTNPHLSCEMMAKSIGDFLMVQCNYKVTEVVVSEDGQHDGIVRW